MPQQMASDERRDHSAGQMPEPREFPAWNSIQTWIRDRGSAG
jgi:hypothetical protein